MAKKSNDPKESDELILVESLGGTAVLRGRRAGVTGSPPRDGGPINSRCILTTFFPNDDEIAECDTNHRTAIGLIVF